MEDLSNIFFFDKENPIHTPDAEVLIDVIRHCGVGVLILNDKDEILFSSGFDEIISSNSFLGAQISSWLNYAFAARGSGTIYFQHHQMSRAVKVRASLCKWNKAKAALFILEEQCKPLDKELRDEFWGVKQCMDKLHYPAMLFKQEVLVAANPKAELMLDISNNQIGKVSFNQLFQPINKNSTKTIASLFGSETAEYFILDKSQKVKANLSNIYLDGGPYRLVQIVTSGHGTSESSGNLSAHDVITIASHDLREPIRTITNFAQLTLDKIKNGKYKQAYEYAQLTNDAAIQMDRLLSDLKTLIQIDNHVLEKKKFAVDSAIKNALKELEKKYDKKLFEVRLHDLPEIYGNEQLLMLMFKNIIDNAIKFRRGEKALIDIAAENDSDKIVVCIRDSGIGIPRRHQKKIFEPFERLNRIDEYPGSGLGLTIAKKIAEKHNGTISIESFVNTGTSVYITLPQ
ncbi:MAG: HAMP domain-containing sensor histidine kinase [Chitinophagales bacterium]|nr:HAMP domain-containing sensor histidine kinase [Chitinophagales bacterium]